ncbi:YciY family protein [Rosenbergiella australiborealis]|uniref:Uncharacterized protein YciY n=1 Tax=Rosenbergiella australiborealis TaxID=1544696 RepID=A0ABS5T1V8_9GAMM|nr:YciY family protein [Rosenbergiella australiborealis]MBT0726335.1 YciY family protein [Rosenbergiella australiborealis]
MKRSRHEVARWRMKRQKRVKQIRWLEAQSRRHRQLQIFRCRFASERRRSILFISA